MKFRLLILTFLFIGVFKVSAQEKQVYRSNFFASVGGGINSYWDYSQGDINLGAACDVSFGYWFLLWLGGRIGYAGITNRKPIEFTGNAHEKNQWIQHSIHTDILWNFFSFIDRTKRIGGIIPYQTIVLYDHVYKDAEGAITNNLELGIGTGVLYDIRISKYVDIYAQTQCVVARSAALTATPNTFTSFIPSITVGVITSFGYIGNRKQK